MTRAPVTIISLYFSFHSLVVTRLVTVAGRPDICEVGGFYMYNGKYLSEHCCNGSKQLHLAACPWP